MTNNNTNLEKTYTRQFVHNIPENILFDKDLSFTDVKIYALIRSFMDTRGDAYPSNNWIAKKLNIDRSTAIRSINRLCKKNYLAREDINGCRHLKIIVSSFPERVVASTPPPSGVDATPPSHGRHPIRSKINKSKNNNINNNIAPIIDKKSDKEILEHRDKYMLFDKPNRTDEEFLRQAKNFVDNAGKDKYSFQARLKALKTIIKSGNFETPASYKQEKNREEDYRKQKIRQEELKKIDEERRQKPETGKFYLSIIKETLKKAPNIAYSQLL